MVFKHLKLHQFFNGVVRTFPTHKHGCRKGAGIWKILQKRLFS